MEGPSPTRARSARHARPAADGRGAAPPTPRRAGRALVAAATAALAAGGCAPNESSLFIVQNQVPTPGGLTGGCTVDSNPGSAARNVGVLDLSVANSYTMYPLLRSELRSSADPMSGRPEVRGIFVEGAEVSLRDGRPDGDEVFPAYSVYFTVYVPPGQSGAPGLAATSFELIPSSIADVLRPQVCEVAENSRAPECPVPTYVSRDRNLVAVVRPFGRTMGGITIDGATFFFSLRLCCHCLVRFPSEANRDDTMHPGPDCLEGTSATQSCALGQDEPVDCRLCASGNPAACQPPGYTPAGVVGMCPLQ